MLGNCGLHVSIVEKLGADPVLFRVVQLALSLVQRREEGLNLSIGDDPESLRLALGLTPLDIEEVLACQPPPAKAWDNPAKQPYLKDLLRLSLSNRQQYDAAFVGRLQAELDQLQKVLEEHCQGEKARLEALKLSSLAELAAGAGHEINNPLAVISGQAQYLLKQLQLADDLLAEAPSPAALLDDLKDKFTRPLQAIVSQTQRIHSLLTDLMQFARPSPPRKQIVPAAEVLHDVSEALQETARKSR